MYNYDNIIARLRAGEDAEIIANEMVGMLNKANRDYNDEVEAAKAQEAQKAKIRAEKIARVRQMATILTDYIRDFYPNSYAAMQLDEEAINAEEVTNMIDAGLAEIDAAASFLNRVSKDMEKAPNVANRIIREANPKAQKVDGQDAIFNFLKNNGLV